MDPCCSSPDAAEGEDVQPFFRYVAMLGRCQRFDQRVGSGFDQNAGKRSLAAAERAQRCANAAAHGEFGECRHAGRAGYADPDRAEYIVVAQRPDPALDRSRIETKLGNQRSLEAALPSKRQFRPQYLVETAEIDARMALRIAGKGDMPDALILHQTGCQQLQAVAEWSYGMSGVAPDDQDISDFRFGRSAPQKIARLGKARETPRRDVRHRVKAGAAQ